jgi:hypothetical protein
MSQFHARTVLLLARLCERCGLVEWQVQLADGTEARAVAYPVLGADLAAGQRVWVNTTAVEMALGTGGVHFIIAPVTGDHELSHHEIGAPARREAGHVMKLRYTPLQHAVRSVEEEGSPEREAVEAVADLAGAPVLAAELHSAAMAAVVAARAAGAGRVVFVMTDGAALPLAFSRTAARLQDDGLLAGTITAGQAFGGGREAVTVASALTAARAVFQADLTIVAQGPGNAGTGTTLGFSGLAQADHLNTAAALGGRPVAALRVSFADPRPHHHGLSRHTATVLGRMTLARAAVAVPELPTVQAEPLRRQIETACLPARHDLRLVDAEDLLAALEPYRDLLTTMGRSLDEERAFFLAACAAARLALDPATGRPWGG